MFTYLLKRLLLFFPTLIIISLIIFGISRLSSIDPVAQQLVEFEELSFEALQKEQQLLAKKWGLDKPVFYFTLSSKAYPDTLHKIGLEVERQACEKLIAQYGNWDKIQLYRQALFDFEAHVYQLPDSLSNQKIEIRAKTGQLISNYKDVVLTSLLEQLQTILSDNTIVQTKLFLSFERLNQSYQTLKTNTTLQLLYLPSFRWHGLNNQYHHWISRFFIGDFGLSYYDARPVADRILEAAKWTVLLNLISIFLAYLLSIPLGVFSAVKRGTAWDSLLSTLLFMLYSLPSFWVATMLIVFITTPEFGMDWFPTAGVGRLDDSASFWQRCWSYAWHLTLPVFCLTYTALAFISRQVRGGMLDVFGKDYIRTARAKGLSNSKVVWKHSFRNALFPIITLFASVLPASLAGSVIIENIFSIPGMGRLALSAIFQADYPVVFTILLITAILTMIGNLIADILYSWADPRVTFT